MTIVARRWNDESTESAASPVILRCERSEPRRMNRPPAGPSILRDARKCALLRMTGMLATHYFARIASGVSGCAEGCALANAGSAIAVSWMRFTVGQGDR